MNLMLFLLVLATATNGLLAGLNVDTALVKLPARRRIGAVAYAIFARGNDLGNGLVVYPLLGIGAALLTVASTVIAFAERTSMELVLLLSLASLLSLLHTFATTRAAPVMLSLKDTPDDAALLKAKLDRFARWHAIRATFQVLAFFVLLWALVVSR
ncbi:MAG: DUF1772 domain-containing protein [Ktedonobacteraceae bacterium]|nr:DUF1772 domain-containing protein [Ktedonobacteraceae bacterium]